jgi:radical SAM superfamily enzyme YgiQ (UPF0313 family)
MRVLLIQPPLEDFYTTPIRLYPLGLLYTASVFREAGWKVGVLDCLSPLRKRRIGLPEEFSYLAPHLQDPLFFKDYYRFGISEAEIISEISAFNPDLIGISAQFTAYYKSVEELASLAKRHFKTPIIVGGNHATVFTSEIRSKTAGLDHVLGGPAEDSLPQFLNSLGGHKTPERMDWKKISPSHDLLPPSRYKIGKKNSISLIASRGCPHNCDFCSVHRMFGRKIDYRAAESVLQEIRWNSIHRNVRLFNFEDDNLSFDRRWFCDFLGAVVQDPDLRDIEFTAMNGLCYPTLDGELLDKMKRAGFRELNLSLISQSGALRAAHGRPAGLEDFERLIRAAQKLGFFITVYIILGLPGQSYAEIRESLDYLLSLGVLVGPSVFYLTPGSELFDEIQVPPDIKDNWNFYRSSAFAVETADLSRAQLMELFLYIRRRNLENKGHPARSLSMSK